MELIAYINTDTKLTMEIANKNYYVLEQRLLKCFVLIGLAVARNF